jgi:hypothetical protein
MTARRAAGSCERLHGSGGVRFEGERGGERQLGRHARE